MSADRGSPRPRCRSRLRDERGIVTSLVLRTAIPLALLALIGYDSTQVLLAQVRAQSVSRAAATACADTWFRLKRNDIAERDALTAAQVTDNHAKVTSINILSDGSCRATATKAAHTLFVQRIGPLKKYDVQQATDDEIRTS
jgi:hypothetical protein